MAGNFEAKLAGLAPDGVIKHQKANFDAVMQLKSDSNFKLTYAPLITPWQNGAADYHESNEVLSFDGKTILSFVSKNGPEGKASPYTVAHILKELPAATTYGYENARLPFLSFWKLFAQFSISELITNPAVIYGKINPQVETSSSDEITTFTFIVRDPKSGYEIKEAFVFNNSPELSLKSIRRDTTYGTVTRNTTAVEAVFENHVKLEDGFVVPRTSRIIISTNGVADVDATLHLNKIV